ncbi:MAG: tetratricopeptide repeat protein [Thermoproteota archaeon]
MKLENDNNFAIVLDVMEETGELIKKGKILLAEGSFEQALSHFEQALLLDQKNAQIWNLKGAALRSMGRYDEAIDCFNKALELDPADKHAS